MIRYLQIVFIILAFVASAKSNATLITYSSSLEFTEIQAREYLVGTEGTFDVPEFQSISSVRLIFSSLDDDFNLGIGPTGGESGVEIAIISDAHDPQRFGIASVIPGNQIVTLYPSSGDPLFRFETVVQQLLLGSLTVSLGSFENFPDCCSFGFPLDQPSFLTLEVSGELAQVSEPGLLLLFMTGIPLILQKRKLG